MTVFVTPNNMSLYAHFMHLYMLNPQKAHSEWFSTTHDLHIFCIHINKHHKLECHYLKYICHLTCCTTGINDVQLPILSHEDLMPAGDL